MTPAQKNALRKLATSGFTPISALGPRVCRTLVAKGWALTTTIGEIALTPLGRWVAREQLELFVNPVQ